MEKKMEIIIFIEDLKEKVKQSQDLKDGQIVNSLEVEDEKILVEVVGGGRWE